MEVSQAIRTKRAVRKFKAQALPEDVIETILHAGRRAQSSKNTQPWHFIAVQDRQMLHELSQLGEWAGHLAGAALGIVFLSPPFTQKFSIAFDLGQAASYMQLAAWERGVGSCLATIYQPERARELLDFPAELETHLAISFGYPENEAQLTTAPRQGGRRSFDETVHWEKW